MEELPPPPPPIDEAPTLSSVKSIQVKPDELKKLKLKKVDEKNKSYIFSLFEEDNPFEFSVGKNGNVCVELKEKAVKDLKSNSKYCDMIHSIFNHSVALNNFEDKEYSWKIWHGSLGQKNWEIPKCVVKTGYVQRADQKNCTNASEYLDDPNVLNEKMKIIADLLRQSKCCSIYSGAGISRFSGIPDYASKAENSLTKEVEEINDPYLANPTYSHHVIANLHKNGLVHHYIQQNHDGLPQKAGYPQTSINEIHGAWFDVSNPVVQFSGKLRGDLFTDMINIEKSTDLCVCLGTSLSGMNADRIVKTPMKKFEKGVIGCLGSVIVNLQMTPVDRGNVSIRVWAKIDDAMKLLVKHLGLKMKNLVPKREKKDVIVCPYNEKGKKDSTKKMILNLEKGEVVRVCQVGAVNEGRLGTVLGKDKQGNFIIKFSRCHRRIGFWWLNIIKNGKIGCIPIVNAQPKFKK